MTAPTPAKTVTLPGVGPVNRTYVIIGAGIAAAGLLYLYKHKSSPTVTGVNTATGTAALPDTGYVNPVPVAGPPSGPIAGTAANDNSTWSQNAINQLSANGWNPQFAATTIGRYLSGQALSQTEQDAVRAAYGLAGYPPQMIAIVGGGTGSGSSTDTTGGSSSTGNTLGWFGRQVQATTYTTKPGDTLRSITDAANPTNPDTGAGAGWYNVFLANGGTSTFSSVTGQNLAEQDYADVPLPAGTTIQLPAQ